MPGLDVGVDAYYKTPATCSMTANLGGLCANRVQLRRGENIGVEFKANYVNGNFRLYGNSPGRRSSAPISCRTSFCSAPTNWPSSPATLSSPIMPNWCPVRPAAPICGTAHVFGPHDFRQRATVGLRKYRSLPFYTQYNLGISHDFKSRGKQADHAALRHRQRFRHCLSDQGRLRHRRVRAAIWPAPWLLCGNYAEIVRRGDRWRE